MGREPPSDVDAGLLIGAEDVLIRPEWSALPPTGIQVEHWTGPLQKVWITRRDPGSIPPGTQGILFQQAPDRCTRGRDVVAREAVGDFDHQFIQAVTTQRHVTFGRTFAGQRDHQSMRRGCERFRSTTPGSIMQPITALPRAVASVDSARAAPTFCSKAVTRSSSRL